MLLEGLRLPFKAVFGTALDPLVLIWTPCMLPPGERSGIRPLSTVLRGQGFLLAEINSLKPSSLQACREGSGEHAR